MLFPPSSVSETMMSELAESVHKILNCDFYNLDRRILEHMFQSSWKKSKSMLPYQKCLRQFQAGIIIFAYITFTAMHLTFADLR